MPKFIVDLWLDGYETEEEMAEACEQFIYDQLNFSGSGVKVMKIPSCNSCKYDFLIYT